MYKGSRYIKFKTIQVSYFDLITYATSLCREARNLSYKHALVREGQYFTLAIRTIEGASIAERFQ